MLAYNERFCYDYFRRSCDVIEIHPCRYGDLVSRNIQRRRIRAFQVVTGTVKLGYPAPVWIKKNGCVANGCGVIATDGITKVTFKVPVRYRYSRMSSKYMVPWPPSVAGAFLVPMPMIIVFTFVRFTPKVARSMTHSFHPESWVAAGSS